MLVTGLTAAILVATIDPTPAQAFPNKQQDCTGCHGSGAVAGIVKATPSTTTPAAGAAYTVLVTAPVNATGEDTGYWIANSTAAGATGTTTGVYGGYSGTMAATYTAPMTAPAAVGTYYYKVWSVKGSTSNPLTESNFALYSITVGTTPPPTTTTTPPVLTANISALSPRHGNVGTMVTIQGSDFGAPGTLQFGTVAVTVSSWTNTSIVFYVPAGVTTHMALVTVNPMAGTASNDARFRFDPVKRLHHARAHAPRHHVRLGGDFD